MHVEVGGTSGTQCSINDSDIRGLISKASGAQSSFSQFYGASAGYSPTMTVGSLIITGDYGSNNYGFNDTSESLLFSSDWGSLTSRDASSFSNSGATVEHLAHNSFLNIVRLIISDNTTIANSGWSTMTVGSTSFSRTSASFTTATGGQGNMATWQWTASNPFGTSGTKSISIS
jgi:hypothetical protein